MKSFKPRHLLAALLAATLPLGTQALLWSRAGKESKGVS